MGDAQISAEETGTAALADVAIPSADDMDAPPTSFIQPELVDRAREGGRKLWAGMVVLATLGGALGLLQFVTPGEPVTSGSDDIVMVHQARILDMVEAGSLSTDDAERLTRAMRTSDGDVLEDGMETVGLAPEISRSGTPAQKAAFALLMEPDTRAEGITTWQTAARSARDWEMLAELTMERETDVALDAMRKALSLDPGSVQKMALLAAAQNAAGEAVKARRTIQSALTLSDTVYDEIVVGRYLVMFAAQRDDWTDMQLAAYTLRSALDDLAEEADIASDGKPVERATITTLPQYADATGRLALAKAYRYDGRHAEAKAAAEQASASFLDMAARATGWQRRALRRRAAEGLDLIAVLDRNDGDMPGALAAQTRAVDLIAQNYAEDPVFIEASAYTRQVVGLGELHLAAGDAQTALTLASNHLAILRGRVRFGIRDAAEIVPSVQTMVLRHRAAARVDGADLDGLIADDLQSVGDIVNEAEGELREAASYHYMHLAGEAARTLAVEAGRMDDARDMLHSHLADTTPFADLRPKLAPGIHLAEADICHELDDMEGAARALAGAERAADVLGGEAVGETTTRIASLRAAIVRP